MGQLQKVKQNESGSLDRLDFVMWYVDLVEVPDADKLGEDAEWTKKYKKIKAFDEVGGSGDCLSIYNT